MPLTKKKGAFFAIYADSPARSTRSQQPALVTTTSTIIQSASSSSPTKQSTNTSRRALSAVQPRSVGFPSDPAGRSGDKGKARALDPKVASGDVENTSKSSVNAKSSIRTISTAATSTTKRTITSKRQFEIFHAPPSPTSTSPTAPAASRPSESPIKKTRSTPRRAQAPVEDKENAPPASDSPASRTRSKAPSSTTLSSPLQPLRLAPKSKGEALVGDGKGTLTLKKGRAVAKLVREVHVLGDVSEAYGAEGSAPEGFHTQRR